MRPPNSAAAFRVKVSPRTCSARTCPVPTSHTTRAAMTVVFPVPAPATITCGSSGAQMAFSCSGLNGIPSASHRSPGSFSGFIPCLRG